MRSIASERDPLALELQQALGAHPVDLTAAALIVAKLEYPALNPAASREALDMLGARARLRVDRVLGRSTRARITALNTVLFDEEGFAGNFSHYDDFRNNYLNAVLERRLGIPITLALVYMEVARRANVDVQGIAFPGHFLLRVPVANRSTGKRSRLAAESSASADAPALVLDPFDDGVELDMTDCRRLLGRHLGTSPEESPFDPSLLRPCTPRQMVARMLNNLKRTYLELRAYARARRVSDLLLAVEPTDISELRDRGLLALHLEDFPAALRDLEEYCRLRRWHDEPDQDERDQVLDQVKMVRRRIGTLN